jgi:hypothetical protein
MPETIQLPRTIGSAQKILEGIEGLLTAKEWEKAAIVWAFTYESSPGPKAAGEIGIDLYRSSISDFARKGISGLKTKVTIIAYRKAWKKAIDEYGAADVKPGQKVTLPTEDFPATRTGTNGYNTEEGATTTIEHIIEQHGSAVVVQAATKADPKFGEQVAADPEVGVTVARRVMAEPEAARSILIDPKLRTTVMDAGLHAIGDEEDLKNPSRVVNRSSSTRRSSKEDLDSDHPLVSMGETLAIESHLIEARRHVQQAIAFREKARGDLTRDASEYLEEKIEQIEMAIVVFRSVNNGEVTDKKLADFINGLDS